VHLVGSPTGSQRGRGARSGAARDQLECSRPHLPDHIEVDVTALGIGEAIFVSDLSVPDAVILNDPGQAVCTCSAAGEADTGPAEVEAAEEAEPELIRKPKAEEEAGEEE
jgi:large subunit ribosomal protein L25